MQKEKSNSRIIAILALACSLVARFASPFLVDAPSIAVGVERRLVRPSPIDAAK